MVAPLIPIAIAAGTVLVKAYMDARARGDEKDRLDGMKADFDELGLPDISIDDADVLEKLNKYETGEIPLPDTFFDDVTPGALQVLESYVPDLAPMVQEARPDQIERSEVGEEGLAAQRRALQRMMNISETSEDPALMQEYAKAQQNAQNMAQSRQESTLQDMARRGTLGSGQQMAADMASNEAAGQMSADMSQDAASNAYRNRLNALMQGAELGGQMESRDIGLQKSNVGIINSFNQRTSKNYQDHLNKRSNAINDAQLENLAAKEREMGYKAGEEAEVYNRNVSNRKFQNDMLDKATSEVRYDQEQPWRNKMDMIKAKHGVGTPQSAWETPQKIVQGLGDAGQTYYSQKNMYEDDDPENLNLNPITKNKKKFRPDYEENTKLENYDMFNKAT